MKETEWSPNLIVSKVRHATSPSGGIEQFLHTEGCFNRGSETSRAEWAVGSEFGFRLLKMLITIHIISQWKFSEIGS